MLRRFRQIAPRTAVERNQPAVGLKKSGRHADRSLQGERGMMDVAQAINAKYWLVSSDDYGNSQVFFKPFLDSRTRELQAVLPATFQSSGKHVLIYDLNCVHEPETSACRNAAQVLFPEGIPLAKPRALNPAFTNRIR